MSAAAEVPVTVAAAPCQLGAVLAREAGQGRRPLAIITGTGEGLGTLAVLADVAAARTRQDAQWGAAQDDRHTPRDWAALRAVATCRADARLAAGRAQATVARAALVELAALVVAQVEAMDRAAAARAARGA